MSSASEIVGYTDGTSVWCTLDRPRSVTLTRLRYFEVDDNTKDCMVCKIPLKPRLFLPVSH